MTTNFIEIKQTSDREAGNEGAYCKAEENDNITTIYVKDDDDTFYGAINLKDLISG